MQRAEQYEGPLLRLQFRHRNHPEDEDATSTENSVPRHLLISGLPWARCSPGRDMYPYVSLVEIFARLQCLVSTVIRPECSIALADETNDAQLS